MDNTVKLPRFGEIILESLDWDYKYGKYIFGYEFNGKSVDLDVQFKEVNDDNLKKVTEALIDLDRLEKIASDSIAEDFSNGGGVEYYINEWNEDILGQIFTEEELEAYISDTDKNISMEERLLSKLRLVRVGIYAESEDSFVVMDYAFGYDMDKGFRDNMLVVKMDKNYKVCDISTEG